MVVDYIAFASNDSHLINQFKDKMKSAFEIKLYGELKSLIRWSTPRYPTGIVIKQLDYAVRILARLNMRDATPRHDDEDQIPFEDHHT